MKHVVYIWEQVSILNFIFTIVCSVFFFFTLMAPSYVIYNNKRDYKYI